MILPRHQRAVGRRIDARKASDFTRRQPALVFGLASLTGFVLLRVLKSNPPSNSRATHLGSEGVGGTHKPGASASA